MAKVEGYVLGRSAQAIRRLEIQDAHFAEVSESLLDELALKAQERVVEIGCGPGGLSRRIMRRLGPGGVLVGVDASPEFLDYNRQSMAEVKNGAIFEPVTADISRLGGWLIGADVLVGRAVLHHIPMVEFMLGRMRAMLRPGTRVGFIEPDFRTLLARLAYLESTSREELAPFLTWAVAINRLYLANGISPAVGATLARTLEAAGYRGVRSAWFECSSNSLMIENMLMFFDEVRERLGALGILSSAQVDELQDSIRKLPTDNLPAAWGMHQVVAEV